MTHFQTIQNFLDAKDYRSVYLFLKDHADKLSLNELNSILFESFQTKKNDYQYEIFKEVFNNGGTLKLSPDDSIGYFLSRVISKKSLKLVKLIIKQFNIDIHSKEIHSSPSMSISEYIISSAAAEGTPDILHYFIEKGLDLHHHNEHPFAWACSHGNLDNAKYLLENFPINPSTYNHLAKTTILSWAMGNAKKNMDVVALLLDNNVQIQQQDLIGLFHVDEKFLPLVTQRLEAHHIHFLYNHMQEKIKDNTYNCSDEFTSIIEALHLKETLNQNLFKPISKPNTGNTAIKTKI